MNLDPLNGEGWRLLWCSALLGVIPEWLHFLVIGVLLCIACGLLHVWAELNRILASLYEMKCLEDAEGQSKNQQTDCQPPQPNCQRNEPISLTVKLRRKPFLLRRNADKLDYLPNQLICLLGQILRLLQKLVRGFLGLLPANLIINRIFNMRIVLVSRLQPMSTDATHFKKLWQIVVSKLTKPLLLTNRLIGHKHMPMTPNNRGEWRRADNATNANGSHARPPLDCARQAQFLL